MSRCQTEWGLCLGQCNSYYMEFTETPNPSVQAKARVILLQMKRKASRRVSLSSLKPIFLRFTTSHLLDFFFLFWQLFLLIWVVININLIIYCHYCDVLWFVLNLVIKWRCQGRPQPVDYVH